MKEYEARLKAAEERVKRERQGSKERVLELENSLKYFSFSFDDSYLLIDFILFYCGFRSLQRQLEVAQKRNTQLNEIIDTNKAAVSSHSPR